MSDKTELRMTSLSKVQRPCTLTVSDISDDRKDLNTSTVGASLVGARCECQTFVGAHKGCPYSNAASNKYKNILTKENKTGWREVDFLTESLSPSPTPLKKKGGLWREDSEKNDLIDNSTRNKCKISLSTGISSTCQLNLFGTDKSVCIRCRAVRVIA